MIGVLDTGIGGLAVVRRIRQLLPDVDIVYLGDNVRGPMALRNPRAVTAFIQTGQRFLTTHGAGLIVLACPIETPPPVTDPTCFDLVSAAAEAVARLTRQRRIGVIEAPAAGGGSAYDARIRTLCPTAWVYAHPTPLLEALIEAGWRNKPETARILRKYLHPLKLRQIDTLVLGSAHYGVLRPLIARKLGKRVAVVEAAEALAAALKDFLEDHPETSATLGRNRILRCCLSHTGLYWENLARGMLGERVAVETAPDLMAMGRRGSDDAATTSAT